VTPLIDVPEVRAADEQERLIEALLTLARGQRGLGNAVLSVANTGPEVPPDDIDRLLQPFQRREAGSAASLADLRHLAHLRHIEHLVRSCVI
jgi:hypothetical protein